MRIFLLILIFFSCDLKSRSREFGHSNKSDNCKNNFDITCINYHHYRDSITCDSLIEILLLRYNEERSQSYTNEPILAIYNNIYFDSLWFAKEPRYPTSFASENIGIIFSCYQIYMNKNQPLFNLDSVFVIKNRKGRILYDLALKNKALEKIEDRDLDSIFITFINWRDNWKKRGIFKLRELNIPPLYKGCQFVKLRRYPK